MPKSLPVHNLTVTDALAGCSCGRWKAPARSPGEVQGTYTLRAHEAHRGHAEETRRPVQMVMALDHQTVIFGFDL
jgi:hypothetical protein